MKCLKCGVEISEDEVFCMDCLLDAQRYPVDPGAAVYLPKREVAEAPKKAPRRRIRTSEDQIRLLRRRVRIQAVAVVLFAAAALAMAFPLVNALRQTHHRTGQNYSAVTQPTTLPKESTEP